MLDQLNILKPFLSLLFCAIIFSGCEKEERQYCDTAVLCLRNNTTDKVVYYSWNSSELSDTLFPGECAMQEYNDFEIEYNYWGRVKNSSTINATFYGGEGSTSYVLDKCYQEFDAPGVYIDPLAHCTNNQFDPELGENHIDCGGVCGSCDFEPYICNYSETKFFINDAELWTDTSKLKTTLDISQESDPVRIGISLASSLSLFIDLYVDSFPEESRMIVAGNELHQAKVELQSIFSETLYSVPEQIFYLVKESKNKWSLRFCDFKMQDRFNREDEIDGRLEIRTY